MAITKARRMRELLEQGIVVSPGVFDGYSAGSWRKWVTRRAPAPEPASRTRA